MPIEAPHDSPVRQYIIEIFFLLLKQFPLDLRGSTKETLPRLSITDRDMVVNKFYRMFNTPQPTYQDAIIWNEDWNIMMLF